MKTSNIKKAKEVWEEIMINLYSLEELTDYKEDIISDTIYKFQRIKFK